MNIIKKIWRLETDESFRKQPKVIILRAFALFLSIVIMFTVVSRTADSLSLAVVRTETASGSVIVHEIRSAGVVEGGTGTPIILPASSVLTEIAVKEGDTVSEGDFLLSYDISEVKQIIAKKQLSLAALQEQLKVTQQQQNILKEKDDLAVDRKDDDSSFTKEEFSLKLEVLGEQIRIARIQLSKYDDIRRDEYNGEDYSEDEYNQLKSALNGLWLQYEQVKFERDQALLKIERDVEDIKTEAPDASEKLKKLEIQQLNLELSVLWEKIKDEGKVYATADGIIKGLSEIVGKRASSEDIGYIVNEEAFEFVSEISEEEKKLVKIGDKAQLEIFGKQKKIDNVLISKIEPVAGKIGAYKVTAKLPESGLNIGDSATMVTSTKSQKYALCVDIPSLYSEGNKHYIFVIKETQTVLGLENTLEKIVVQVLDKNEKYAAISGTLPQKAKIVSYSDKPINEGDRVRVEA